MTADGNPPGDPPPTSVTQEVMARRAALLDAARPDAFARQHAAGKLSARERLALLVDPDSFEEIGGLVEPDRHAFDTQNIVAPADGVVTGSATIEGRPVGVIAFDFTVLGGSNGRIGEAKLQRVAELAQTGGHPLVMLMDGGGHRIQEGLDSAHYARGTELLQVLAQLSGWVPVVAAMMGPGFAAASNFAAMADFVVMVRATSTMGIAGPALVKAATGEVVSKEALGGAQQQTELHGIAHLAVDSDQEALQALQRYLSFLPANTDAPQQVRSPVAPPPGSEGVLRALIPANRREVYDVRKAIRALCDADSLLEIQPRHARNLVVCLARLQGRPIGVVANQSLHLGGTLTAAACEKGAHFISVCDAFGLPLVFLIDIPGLLVGSGAEQSGLARRSARMLFELGHATVPRVSVVMRKGYGLGYVAMCGGRSFGADLALAWPTAEICAMSIEGAVDVAYQKRITAASDPAQARETLIRTFQDRLGPLQAAEGFGIDDVIDPADTRRRLVATFARCAPRREHKVLPRKRHGISPI